MMRFGRILPCGLVLLAACGGESKPVPVPVGGMTVNGTVISKNGDPVSGATVLLNGAGKLTTGTDGTFRFSGVTPPYNLSVRAGANIAEYRALTRANPQIAPVFVFSGRHATVQGSVTGPTYPLPGSDGILLAVSGNAQTLSNASASDGTYTSYIDWWGGSPLTTDLVALRYLYNGALSTPSNFQTGKKTGLTLTDGAELTGQDIPLNPPMTTLSSILVSSAGAYTNKRQGYYWTLKANGATFITQGTIPLVIGAGLNFPSEGASLGVEGYDADGGLALIVAPANGGSNLSGETTINLPASPVLQNAVPDNGATGISKSPTFSRTGVAGTTLYLLRVIGAGLTYTVFLPSTSSTVPFPDFSSLEAPLLGSTTYSWYMESYETAGYTPDGLTDPATPNRFRFYTASSLKYFKSPSVKFTTAP